MQFLPFLPGFFASTSGQNNVNSPSSRGPHNRRARRKDNPPPYDDPPPYHVAISMDGYRDKPRDKSEEDLTATPNSSSHEHQAGVTSSPLGVEASTSSSSRGACRLSTSDVTSLKSGHSRSSSIVESVSRLYQGAGQLMSGSLNRGLMRQSGRGGQPGGGGRGRSQRRGQQGGGSEGRSRSLEVLEVVVT